MYTFHRRFDESFKDVKAAIDDGSLGKVQAIKTTTRDSPKPSYEFLKAAGMCIPRLILLMTNKIAIIIV